LSANRTVVRRNEFLSYVGENERVHIVSFFPCSLVYFFLSYYLQWRGRSPRERNVLISQGTGTLATSRDAAVSAPVLLAVSLPRAVVG
jgi:hypothetical protein